MDGSFAAGGHLRGRLAELTAELDRRIADEQARAHPDAALIRRLTRERLLARDRLAALSGCAMPPWARADLPAAE